MPNTYIESRDRWEQLATVDYLSAFANAWLAFNAWYRNAYAEHQDRKIINEFKSQPNVIRNGLVPLLTGVTEEAEQIRANIGLLHHRLENHHLHSGKGAEKHRITLTNVYLRDNTLTTQAATSYNLSYEVVPGGAGAPAKQVTCKVTNSAGVVVFQLIQPAYDQDALEVHTDFIANLNQNQRGRLLALYRNVNPLLVCSLLERGQGPVDCGAYQFTCTAEELFAGIVEVIYLMRCTLFHGELVPSKEASACYEPAYLLVRKFLHGIA